MAFPLPKLLPRIEELLQEVQWLDGLILITDSDRACFVSFSQVDPVSYTHLTLPTILLV